METIVCLGHMPTRIGQVVIESLSYADGNPAVTLTLTETGEEFLTLSVNLPQDAHTLDEDEFFVKTWSENEYFIQDILATGLFEDTGRRVSTGWVEAQVWRILKEVAK